MTKENVTAMLDEMPQEFRLDELFEKLVFIQRVEQARKEVKEGKKIPHSEIKKKVLEWRK